MEIELPVPDHTTLSRRGKVLRIDLPKGKPSALHLVVDSTGLKVYGEGEWKMHTHGKSKRRTWRKSHLSVNRQKGGQRRPQLLRTLYVSCITDTTTYLYKEHSANCQINIPPCKDAHIWQHGNSVCFFAVDNDSYQQLRNVCPKPPTLRDNCSFVFLVMQFAEITSFQILETFYAMPLRKAAVTVANEIDLPLVEYLVRLFRYHQCNLCHDLY